jgi:hypothetical protein
MASVSRSRFFRGCVLLSFLGAAVLVGFYGFSVLLESVNGRGNNGGNALLFAIGFILLLLSLGIFVFVAKYWTPQRPTK